MRFLIQKKNVINIQKEIDFYDENIVIDTKLSDYQLQNYIKALDEY